VRDEVSARSFAQTILRVSRATLVAHTLLVFLLAFGIAWSEQTNRATMAQASQAQSARAAILYLDEVLTMSARMYAVRGEAQWRARYGESLPLLDAAIADARGIAGSSADAAVHEIDASNRALVELEQRAFGLAEAGQMAGAVAVLDGAQYGAEKARYAAALARFVDLLTAMSERASRRAERVSRTTHLGLAIHLVVALGGSWLLSRAVKRARTGYERTEGVARAARADAQLTMDAAQVCVVHVVDDAVTLIGATHLQQAGSTEVSRVEELVALFDEPKDRVLALLTSRGPDDRSVDVTLRTRAARWVLVRGNRAVRGDRVSFDGALVDVTRRFELELELRAMTADLERRVAERSSALEAALAEARRLTAQLAEVEQMERVRLAHLLHEELQQTLAAARLEIQLASGSKDVAVALLDEAIRATRTLSQAMSGPVEDSTLIEALEGLAAGFGARHRLEVRVEHAPDARLRVSKTIRNETYAAVRELLFNVTKHAHVARARLEIREVDAAIEVTVHDDGPGFDPDIQPSGFGLPSVRSRVQAVGGALRIETPKGRGTTVTLRLPATAA
jgi:signal transduction histidine kinase